MVNGMRWKLCQVNFSDLRGLQSDRLRTEPLNTANPEKWKVLLFDYFRSTATVNIGIKIGE